MQSYLYCVICQTCVTFCIIRDISFRLDTKLYGRQFDAAPISVPCSATVHSLPGYVFLLF
jgi:hypothetical protein